MLSWVAGCQFASKRRGPVQDVSLDSIMSIEAARKIAADFRINNYVVPPRSIDSLRDRFGQGRAVPASCEAEWEKRQTQISTAQKKLQTATGHKAVTRAADLVVLSERLITTGRFDEALNNIEAAYKKIPEEYYAVRKAIFLTQQARLHARIGNLDLAKEKLGLAIATWTEANPEIGLNKRTLEHVQITGTLGSWFDKPTGRLYFNAGMAAISRLQGSLPLAEYHFREAIKNFAGDDQYSHINKHELRAELALVIMQQGRLLEAEAEARAAINLLDTENPEKNNYDGNGAAPVAALAAILLEQGKVADARYVAGIAVNMHEVGCSEPQSLGLTEARKILIDAMAWQTDWSGILEQASRAREMLGNNPVLFRRQFGMSLSYIEAEIYAGSPGLGRDLAKRLRREFLRDYGATSYSVAEIEGILALVETYKLQQYRSALGRYSKALPVLTNHTERKDVASAGRRERILQGYLWLLSGIANQSDYNTGGLNVPEEILRVISFLNRGSVDQAVFSGITRTAAIDPGLSGMIREAQDLTEESLALGDILAYIQSAPDNKSTSVPAVKLKSRLVEVVQAKQALEAQILNRFPAYLELLNPRPMTIAEIETYLDSDQALLVIHPAEESTFIWGLSAGGKVAFATVDIGRKKLKAKVSRLRYAVDPGEISTLEDIPDFDVPLAYELYKSILKPVENSWENANQVFLIAGSPLDTLPFSMLSTGPEVPDADGTVLFDRYRKVDWLINKIAITVLPSVNSLQLLAAEKQRPNIKRRSFIGFGDPVFSVEQDQDAPAVLASRGFSLRAAPKTRANSSAGLSYLPPLPDTRDELVTVARALDADLVRDLYLGRSASEQSVKTVDLSNYTIVSFATHGLVPGDLNGLSEPALALSSPLLTGSNEDGLLTMSEILGLRLEADLVVLSACNTAAADNKGAEAVSGLGRAFFYAGTKALLVSNWAVHSGATSGLMAQMFTRLARETSLSRSEALRQAKLFQISQDGFKIGDQIAFSYAHPIFWAPFTIVGDGG